MAINDPRDIPGLLVWYSAEAETGYANGAQMTGWTDLSGNGNNATAESVKAGGVRPYWQATTGSAGGPSVAFKMDTQIGQETGYFYLPSGAMSAATAGEVAATIKSGVVNTSTSQGAPLKFGTDASGTHYPYSSTIYDDFATSSRRSVTPGVDLTLWHRVNIRSGPSDFAYLIDGVSKAAAASNTVAWRSVPMIGNTGITSPDTTRPGGPSADWTSMFKGELGCLVLYSRVLTATERGDLDAWLQAHPSGGAAPAQAPAVTLTGTAPAVTGAFDVTVTSPPPAVTLTATAPTVAGAFDVAVAVPPVSADLSGAAPKVTGTFAIELPNAVTGDLAGTAPAVSGSFGITASGPAVEVATDSVNRLNGMTLVTEWHVEITEPVTIPTRQPAHDYAVATSLPNPTLVEGRPT